MSWDAYVTGQIINSGCVNHKWENMCESGALLDATTATAWTSGFNMGDIKVQSDGKEITINQSANLADAMKQPTGNTSRPGGIYLNGLKYITTSKTENSLYLKRNGGGAVVCKSGKALVVGTWAQAKKGKKDGKEKAQNHGDCTTIVEELANYLRSIGY